jgi:nicotinamidase-related amidase
MQSINLKNCKAIVLLGSLMAAGLVAGPSYAGDIIAEWASVKPPPPPALKPVTADPKTTALLMLDFVKQACNAERRPRCLETVPPSRKLLTAARASNVMVIYTGFGKATKADIVPDLAATDKEPYVVSFLNKYLGTDLEKMLKERGIQTVITIGTAAHGAVIISASESASRGFNVIVPVDGISSETTYAEQYTAWHLVNAPVIAARITLTRTDMVKF